MSETTDPMQEWLRPKPGDPPLTMADLDRMGEYCDEHGGFVAFGPGLDEEWEAR